MQAANTGLTGGSTPYGYDYDRPILIINTMRIDDIHIITSTFGKALGGASGGFISSSSEIVETLRQKSRPYLFSNSLAPPLVAACIKVFEIITKDYSYKNKLEDNTIHFRNGIKNIGLDIKGEDHPIVLEGDQLSWNRWHNEMNLVIEDLHVRSKRQDIKFSSYNQRSVFDNKGHLIA